MKKLIALAIIITLGKLVMAQNIQLHYDLGDERKMFTTTVEMFKPDKMGSTFFFIDMDYGSDASGIDGINLAYWEIARSFKWNDTQKIEPRVEYNSGFGRGQFSYMSDDEKITETYNYSINSSYLIGAQRTWNNADFSKVFTLQANYKYIKDSEDASFQLTGVWGLHFYERKISFTGFADFWKQEGYGDFVFLAEPQLWWNTGEKFSFGTEIEISNNFVTNGSQVNPTLAAKWTF